MSGRESLTSSPVHIQQPVSGMLVLSLLDNMGLGRDWEGIGMGLGLTTRNGEMDTRVWV